MNNGVHGSAARKKTLLFKKNNGEYLQLCKRPTDTPEGCFLEMFCHSF